ncbi:hypothetical protein D9613_002112 [Agrocybe pediades]|uniref:TPPC8 first Ig-like domain-containing protein n=1 Tax=Agrocybe pediades TaxID=84607 RepID=A0A8H4R6U2_9AGAR|nr:hypothetical protein D9613_002112 [Agrocybe pediades]
MAPALPSSLSPHICILTSPDLAELLEQSSLPPLFQILQSFSPLPQVTTRTTALVSVPHASFNLRFSDLQDVEEACREDDEQRAIRTIDWITGRISSRCSKWLQEVDSMGAKAAARTPWWDELRRCTEGDFVPSKTEGWNHPVALILAVSTTAPNPLQAITALHSRNNHLPPWVDTNVLRYTLIVHPSNSPLTNEEAGALHNAVKKQYGLHCYLLELDLPKVPPAPIPVPAMLPRLPVPSLPVSPQKKGSNASENTGDDTIPNSLRLGEKDVQHTAKFTREFLVMSLIPWMEKCVLEWNENFSSTRRLPSRLFSSTRRLFGSASPSPGPTHTSSMSMSTPSLAGRSATLPLTGGPPPPSQQRRLAEFATILGDYKLAIMVWEALRKESKGGSDILPLLLAPSPAVPLHAQTALASIHPNMSDLPPNAQLRALSCAVRWEMGIPTQDLLSNMLEGERWLVWAASNAEEAPSALLLAHAALLSTMKKAQRRSALWYVLAANRLEKCGIKPLTMYFLRRAEELYSVRPPKELSPSFWDSEGKSPTTAEGLEDILSGIAHPLGRMLYTTGDVVGAVKLFLSLLRGAPNFASAGTLTLGDTAQKATNNDKLYLDDFRVAYNYWKSTEPEKTADHSLQLPIKLCNVKQSSLRFSGDNTGNDDVWAAREEAWKTFWKSQDAKPSIVPSGKVCTNGQEHFDIDMFWVNLVMRNPLDAEVNLSDITLLVQEVGMESISGDELVEVEIIKEVIMAPKESISVPISLKPKRSAKLRITHARYNFLSLLPITESLASRGQRLHATALQRQKPTYAPDVFMQVEVVPSDHRLLVTFVEDSRLVLLQGENKSIRLWLKNAGDKPISEVWMISGPEDEIWLGEHDYKSTDSKTETFRSFNSLKPQAPRRLPLLGTDQSSTILNPGQGIEVPVIVHAGMATGNFDLDLLFVFREDDSHPFHSTTLTRSYEVQALFDISVLAEPSLSQAHSFLIDLDLTNTSQTFSPCITQLTCISPQWTCESLTGRLSDPIAPTQCCRVILGASYWSEGSGSEETFSFVSQKLGNLLKGGDMDDTPPPPLDILSTHISQGDTYRSIKGDSIMDFVQSGRRKYMSQNISRVHSYVAANSFPSIFPLYNPSAIDFVIFWHIQERDISGHIAVHGITLGAGHGRLNSIVEEAESAKVKRSMYAETRRENMEVLDAIRNSEWNAEMNPIVLSVKDAGIKTHDFSKGQCHVSVEFRLRNHSSTRSAEYTLKLGSDTTPPNNLLNPPYAGRMTFRGSIPPSGTAIVHPKLWVTRPGAYSLGGWVLETKISEEGQNGQQLNVRRYVQQPSPSEEGACVVVRNSSIDDTNN